MILFTKFTTQVEGITIQVEGILTDNHQTIKKKS